MQYYALNVWKELQLDQIDDSLFIVSDDEARSAQLTEKMKYFLQNVSIIDRSEDFREKITAGNTMIPYDLQTLLVCGF